MTNTYEEDIKESENVNNKDSAHGKTNMQNERVDCSNDVNETVENEEKTEKTLLKSFQTIGSHSSFLSSAIQSSINATNNNAVIDEIELTKSSHQNKNRKLAGFRQQFNILTWKNLILSKRNKCGLITEIFCPFFILLLLIIIRYFVDATQINDQSFIPKNVLDVFPITNATNSTLLLYYPNNTFIESIMKQAVSIIKQHKPYLNVTGKCK